jgi:hypothetical protein
MRANGLAAASTPLSPKELQAVRLYITRGA